MFQALKKLLHVMPCAVEFIDVQLWRKRELLFSVAEKTIGCELWKERWIQCLAALFRQKGWQWENFLNHKVVLSNLTNTGFMSHAKILLP